ncbi:MAG: histidine phosphatase family protein [Kordiimonadaceae bacterium]|nr:histidine phosphatase family protein [Kordiimonadaceae bacterium]
MRHFLFAAILACGFAFPAYAEATVIYLVRHTEKQHDGTKNPSLTPGGVARAGALAALLKDVPFTKVYSTNYKRTRMTAALVAAQENLDISPCGKCSPEDMPALAKRLKDLGGTILMVAHSHTTPMLAAELTGKPLPELAEHQYDHVYVVTVEDSGKTTLTIQYTEPRTP